MGIANLAALLACGLAMGFGALGSGWGLGYTAQGALRALARQPASAQTLFLRGAVKLRLGRQAEGEADLAAARKLHPRIDAEYGRYQLL